jgi:hypothetical protein
MKQRSKRQSFLGANSDEVLAMITIAIVGASGGGTPIAQALAHIGFGTTHLFDSDFAEEHHRHRLVGISSAAIKHKWKKVRIAQRMMQRVHPEGKVIAHACTWQDAHHFLRSCNLVFSAVDGYLVRDELERYLRRFHVPLIDIGMDVTRHDSGHTICGQTILSLPGSHCMRCFGFIREDLLQAEARRYGDAGERAQVIWPNSSLAATAVGMAMSLLLPWHPGLEIAPYLIYDGNRLEITPSPRLRHLPAVCPHYMANSHLGDLTFSMSQIRRVA